MMDNQLNLEQVEQEIEISIEAAKGAVERKNKLERLLENPDFKEVFEEGYFKNEAARLVSLLCDGDWRTEERRKEIIDDMLGISSVRQYIIGIRQMGKHLERQIAESESALEELRAEATEGE